MNKNKYWQVTMVVLLVAAAAGAYWYSSPTPQTDTASLERAAGMITLAIEDVYDATEVPITEGETVLEALQMLHNQIPEKIALATREYEGLGVLVDAMGTLKNGDAGEYWQYKVNDIMPQVGADKLILKDGDRVLWYFAKSEF